MTLIQFIGGIALLVIGGGAYIWLAYLAMNDGVFSHHIPGAPNNRPLNHRRDEHSDGHSIGGGEGFIHGGADK